MLGPIDYVVIAFPGSQFKGEILPELSHLVETGTIRIIDLLFITRGEDDVVAAVEIENMPAEITEAFKPFMKDFTGLLSDEDVAEAGALLEPGSSAGLLLFEHVWAKDLKQAVIGAGGVLVADGRIRPENVERVLSELAAAPAEGDK
ncbi:hypothetical protein HJC99_02730 [Candidatus Saccharibacteria bacterium]|nr:hypothetical protein [Candidatus Saccharibacteria bacterium]